MRRLVACLEKLDDINTTCVLVTLPVLDFVFVEHRVQ
jgi:hypothetical protein